MRKKIWLTLIIIFSSLFIPFSASANNLGNLDFYKHALIRYQDSGQYEKEIMQVDRAAQGYLATRIAQNNQAKNKKKLAAVFDIDETSLSNYNHMKAASFGGTPAYTQRQTAKADDPAIQPTLQLYNYAKSHGVAVFFITGRDEKLLRAATAKNLRAAGYDGWNGLYMRPHDYKYASIIPFKSSTRKKIEDMGYDIVLSIGDQHSDLDGGYDDQKFKVPNPFYYVP